MISALVLAAGRSRRMGAPKLLLPLAGKPVIACVVDEVLRSGVDAVHVVVGPDGQAIQEALPGRRVAFVVNPAPDDGMLGSVRCGLRALPTTSTAALVVLGDQPRLPAGVVDTLLRVMKAGTHGLVVPTWQGRRGHPLLLSLRYRDELLARHDDAGLRGLLQAHPEDVLEVEVDTPAVLEDMDTPEEYQSLAQRILDAKKAP